MKAVYLLMVIWIGIIWLSVGASVYLLPPQTNFLGITYATPSSWAVWPLANFDGEHYLAIASRGYRDLEFAFFPIYPLVVFLGSLIVGQVLISGLLISLICCFILMRLIWQLFQFDYSPEEVVKGIILLLCFPSAFYLVSVYSESLFLCLVMGSFLAARQQKYWLAGGLGLVASMTRFVGVMLAPALMLAKPINWRRWWVWIIPLGTLVVIGLNYGLSGNGLAFISTQPKFNASRTVDTVILLPQVIYRYERILATQPWQSLAFWMALQELAISLVVFGLLIGFWRRIRREYWLFSFGAILVPTLTGTLSSMPRYVLAALPLFFVVAKLVKNRFWFGVIAGLMLMLQIINIMLFANGYFVA